MAYKDYYGRKEQGLCVKCPSRAVQGRVFCPRHQYKDLTRAKRLRARHPEYNAVTLKRIRGRYLKENRCLSCSSPLLPDENRYCVACLSKPRGAVIRGY